MREDTNEANEEDLVFMTRIARGDEEAFRLLIEKHQQAVIGTVAKMTNNSPESEDIAQQVFLRLWKAAPRYKATAKFTTYLFTITRNLVFNETQKKSRRKEHSLEEQEDEWHQAIEDNSSPRPDQALSDRELSEVVDQAIAQLPEKQRLAVILRQQERMPYEEMADILDLSISAIKSQLFRARATLRESLKSYLQDE